MTELQIEAAQAAIDILAHVGGIAVVMAVSIGLIRFFIGFIKGRY